MTETSDRRYEELSHLVRKHTQDIARLETQYAVINTKLTAILWVLGTVGAAVIAGVVRIVLGGM